MPAQKSKPHTKLRIGPLELSCTSYSTDAIELLRDNFHGSDDPMLFAGMPISFDIDDVESAAKPFDTVVHASLRRGFRKQQVRVELSLNRDAARTPVAAWSGNRAYELRREGHRISIHAPHNSEERVHLLNSVAMELWRRTVENLGGTIVHGSAVALGGDGWLITGSKGAGKTTTAFGLAMASDFDLVENDRTALIPQGDDIVVMPIPNFVRIGLGTAHGLGIAEQVLTHEEAEAVGEKVEGKVTFLRQELCSQLGLKLCGAAVLRGVVLPTISRSAKSTAGRKAEPREVLRTLRTQRRLPVDARLPDDLVGVRRVTLQESRELGNALFDRAAKLKAVAITYPGADRASWSRIARHLG